MINLLKKSFAFLEFDVKKRIITCLILCEFIIFTYY